MAIWKDQNAHARKEPVQDPYSDRDQGQFRPPSQNYDIPRRLRTHEEHEAPESVIAANIAIEGNITGSGHVRVAGRFKGDIQVEGHLTIEAGAKVIGGIRAHTVIIAGELEGNIHAAERVEVLETATVTGDVTASMLSVAAGSKMRGRATFGWADGAQDTQV